MKILLLIIGIIIGNIISEVIFLKRKTKRDNNPSIKAMHDYIHQLEEENEDLKQRNARLKEYTIHNGY